MEKKTCFGEHIRQVRESKGIKANFVAEKIGVSPSSYTRIEKGEFKMTIDRAVQIAEVLGVDVAIFFELALSDTHNDNTGTEG